MLLSFNFHRIYFHTSSLNIGLSHLDARDEALIVRILLVIEVLPGGGFQRTDERRNTINKLSFG